MLSIFIASVLFLSAAAIGHEQSKIETAGAECVQSAQAMADDLAPYAEAVAGRKLKIVVVSGRPQGITGIVEQWGGKQILVAQVNGSREIVVFPIFCPGPPRFREETIAHEIGHIIDMEIEGSIFWESWAHAFDPWETRPVEIRANEYADKIILLKRGEK